MTKSRASEWLVAGVVVALLLAGGTVVAARREPILVALGAEVTGGAPTIHPTLFVEPTPEEQPTPDAQLEPPPQPHTPAPPPGSAALQQRLAELDTSELVDPDGAAAALAYQVVDVATGDVVVSRNPDAALIPASNTKTLTILAVFNAFDGDERFTTRVVSPDEATIVLVGGGDPMLAAEPSEDGAYPQLPSLRTLAEDTAAALASAGRETVRLGFDDSWFEGAGWAATWPENYRTQVTEVSALWADEGRVGGSRSRTPALAAAQRFAGQLAELGVIVEGEPQPMAGAGDELARVESLPLHVLAEQAMLRSNNSFTEVLGFQLAKHTGHPAGFEGATAAIEEQLRALDLWDEGTHLDDASGLSRSNRVSAGMLARANRELVSNPRLTAILDGLPVAGVTGSLRGRFVDPVAQPARGVARAKTGTLSLVSSLAGVTTTNDGAVVAFAIMANGQVSGWWAKHWEDQVVGAITGCGC